MNKKTTQIVGKAILGLLFAMIMIALLIELAIGGAVIWLQSQNGQDWARDEISALAEESGYEISFNSFSYAFPQGLEINDVVIGDADGVIAALDEVVLRIDFAGLMLRHLGLSVDVQTLTLHRLPAQETDDLEDEELALSPVTLPDLYFSTISLKALDIQKLDIKEVVFNMPLILSPTLESEINLQNRPAVTLDIALETVSDEMAWLPDSVDFKGAFNFQTLDLKVDRLDLSNEFFTIQAQGSGNLGAAGTLGFTLKGDAEKLLPLTGVEGELNMSAHLIGTLQEPALLAKARLDLALFKERGLDTIDIEIQNENLRGGLDGTIALQSTYRDMPLSLFADFKYYESIVMLSDIEGTAPDLKISGAFNVNTDTMLAEGNIAILSDNLGFYSRLAGADIGGAGEAQIILSSTDEKQAARINAELNAIRYETYKAQTVVISSEFPDISNIDLNIWPTQMDVKATNIIAGNTRVENLNATIRDEGQDRYKLKVEADGQALQNFTLHGRAALTGLKQNTVSARDINLTLNSQGSALIMTGAATLNNLDLSLNTDNFALTSLPLELPEPLKNLVLGGALSISGTPAEPIMAGNLTLSPSSRSEGSSFEIALKPYYKNQRVGVDFTGTGNGIRALNGEASVPMKVSLSPLIFELDGSAPLTGKVNLAADVGDLVPVFLPPGHRARGNVSARAVLRGTMNDPDLSGDISLREGTYEYVEYGIQLVDIVLDGDLNRDGVKVTTSSAKDGSNGVLSGKGRVSFQDMRDTALQLRLKDFQLLDSKKAKGLFSADLNLQGRADTYLLNGTITPGQIDILIPERFQTSIPELNIVRREMSEENVSLFNIIELDIKTVADDRIFVRGWGLDAEFGGKLAITGTLGNPQINGSLSSLRGRYEEFGRRFTLDRAHLRFQGQMPPSPYLDIAAVSQLEDIQATVHLTGELENPSLSFSSSPPLPDDEIMARILFGRDLSTITPFQAVQLKQTLDRFSGRGGSGFDPLGKLRSITGLDDIRVDTEGEDTSVGVGKYLSDDVYLELEKGQGENSGAAKVQIELTPSISLESEVGQDAQAGAGVTWSWDY